MHKTKRIGMAIFIWLTLSSPGIACEGFKGCATGCENPVPCNLDFEQRVLEILNSIRVCEGLNPLKMNSQLTLAARYHAQDMACEDYFAHDSFDRDASGNLVMVCGTWARIRAFYPSAGGENCAAGYGSPESVMTGWMDSPGHHDNMLSPSHREIGVGYYRSADAKYQCYWVQDLGSRGNYYPVIINLDSAVTRQQEVNLFIYGADRYQEMRLKNNDENWSEWCAFKSNLKWNLLKIHGEQTVWVEMRTSDHTNQTLSGDEIFLELPGAVASGPGTVDDSFALFPNYPNPFNPETTIRYQLPRAGELKLVVYNISGQVVKILFQGEQSAGIYEERWDGRDELGHFVSGGIYFCHLECGGIFVESRKMVLLK